MKKTKKHLLVSLLVLITLSIFSLGLIASGQTIGALDVPWFEDCVPGQIIVGIQENLSISQGTLATANQGSSSSLFLGVDTLSVKDLTDMSEIISLIQQKNDGNMDTEPQEYNGPQVLLLELASDSKEDMLQAIEILEQNPLVSHASPNYITRTSSNTPIIPKDPLYEYLWGMEKIHAPEAWDIWTGSRFDRESCPVNIAVVDSGIDYTHPDLIGNVKASWGYDFINNDQDAMDDFGHGTHVAGTIGSVGDNNIGVVGVNWQVSMIPIKVFDSGGWGTWDALIEAIVYAETWKIPIINYSGGGNYFDPNLEDVINNYSGLLIAAAGNFAVNNDINPFYPASYDCDNIISVAASYYDDELCQFYPRNINIRVNSMQATESIGFSIACIEFTRII